MLASILSMLAVLVLSRLKTKPRSAVLVLKKPEKCGSTVLVLSHPQQVPVLGLARAQPCSRRFLTLLRGGEVSWAELSGLQKKLS